MYKHFLFIACLGGIEFTTQPKDATVCLGGTADFSCDYTGTRSHPQWIINSTLYTSSNLPPNTRYDGASRTLVVSNVTREQNNVTYQCFLALFNPVNDSICFLLSSIGKIKVNTSGKGYGHTTSCSLLIHLVYCITLKITLKYIVEVLYLYQSYP